MRNDLKQREKKQVLLEIFDKGDSALNIMLRYKCFLESKQKDKLELKSSYQFFPQ